MERIAPSQKIRQRIYDVLHHGMDESESDITTTIIHLGIERLIQEMLEEEVKDHLGRDRYERRAPDQEHRGYRNGYEPGRMRTGEGEIVVQVPQVRDAPETYRSPLMARLRGNSEVLERLAIEMYTRGLSARDIEDAIAEATGERLLSRTGVSRITETIWEDHQAFIQRDLSSFPLVYLFLDAVFESLRRQGGGKEGVLCAWAICADGRKVLLHMALGNKESNHSPQTYSYDQSIGAELRGRAPTYQGDRALLHREELSEARLQHPVASELALAGGAHERIRASADCSSA